MHGLEPRPIPDLPPASFLLDQTSGDKSEQMVRKRRRRKPGMRDDLANRQPLVTRPNQQPKDLEPRLMPECGECADDGLSVVDVVHAVIIATFLVF